MTQTDLDDKVISISYKWKDQICQLNSNQLKEEMFLERIKKGALYFHSQLTELFNHTLEITKDVQTNNKVAAKRFENTYSDLQQTLIVRQELLSTMITETFTITTYLEAKQNAILNSLDDEKEKKGRKKEKNKAPKGASAEISYNLFKEGKSIKQIAKERGLTPVTIEGHLATYVANGQIKIEEIVEPAKVSLIRRIAKAVGQAKGLKVIKELCPSDITYGEILLVLKAPMP